MVGVKGFRGRKRARGFTLIELMIAVAIVAVLASFAFPAYQKFTFDAKEAEGVQILMSAYKDELRVKLETGSFTEYLDGAPAGKSNLYYRAGRTTRFNLIVGKSGGDGRYALKLPGLETEYPAAPLKVNDFGFFNVSSGPDRFAIGVEADLKGDGKLHVLAIDQSGRLQKICDQWTGTSTGWYASEMGSAPVCVIPTDGGGCTDFGC